ncbi:MAG TPA: type II toxin-antitoxin system PemK/MazF family toxin [Methanothrix sp.]|jgi:mRNA interferase MazF|nr:type II toxin-antitoxin system PemK/MazF family toxin [Methanothrix sp.]
MKGDIVLVPFPNSDLSTWKRRPALVLYEDPLENETTIAYISSKIPMTLSANDILITRGTPSFEESGLNHNSVIKINKITAIKTHFIAGLLGSADESLQAQVNSALDACLKFPVSFYL